MTLRKQVVENGFFHDSEWPILDTLPPFVADNVLLVPKRSVIDLVQQVTHAVRLQPQRNLELVTWNRFKVIRSVKVCRSVDIAGAHCLKQPEVLVCRDVLRLLKHHVLE